MRHLLMPRFAWAALILGGFGSVPECRAADPRPLALGASAPDFRLPATDGKTYSQADFADSKVLMVVFTCNHCPTANAYEERFARFNAEYGPERGQVRCDLAERPAGRSPR